MREDGWFYVQTISALCQYDTRPNYADRDVARYRVESVFLKGSCSRP